MRRLILLSMILVGCSEPDSEPTKSTLSVSFEGQTFQIEDEVDRQLFGPNFVDLSVSQTIRPDCYRLGRLIGAEGAVNDSIVGLKHCEGEKTEGFAILHDRWFSIEAGAGGLEMIPARLPQGKCGVVHDKPAQQTVLSNREGYALQTQRPAIIEVLVLRDRAWFQRQSQGAQMADPILAAQAASVVYARANFVRPILPVVVGLVDAPDSNPWGEPTLSGGNARPGSYLDNLNAWLYQSRTQLPRHDHASLLSGLTFTGATIGLANLDSACDQQYQGALVWGEGVAASVGQTFAHELGHTLGMWHDGEIDNCNPNNFVMTAVYDTDGPFPTRFSTCSESMGSAYLNLFDSSCISSNTLPAHAPRCGDGIVEGTEDCDCGPLGCEGVDPCCTDTCNFRQGASCSTLDGCCDPNTCVPFQANSNHECRAARSACDVPETCDGDRFCPPDKVRPTGEICQSGAWTGSCFMGQCVSRGESCELLAQFYQLDTPPFQDQCAQNNNCGPIPCIAENACVILEEWAYDGTPCAAGRQCFDGSCVPSGSLPGQDGCAEPGRDSDDDGIPDCQDGCPFNPELTAPGPCGCQPCVPDTNNSPNNLNPNNSDPNNPDPTPENPVNPGNPDEIKKPSKDSSCSVGGLAPSLWALALMLGFRRR